MKTTGIDYPQEWAELEEKSMAKEKEQALAVIDYSDPKIVATLRATVAQGLTDAEFVLFSQFCRSTGLNAFKKEIWAIKANGRLQLMTGINGFHAIANQHPQYDGLEAGFVGPDGSEQSLKYPKNDFIGAWARVHRKDRKIPMEGVAMVSEYDKQQGNWKSMRRVMIVKCAESVALRKAFPQELNGLYTQEEMPAEYSDGATVEVEAKQKSEIDDLLETPIVRRPYSPKTAAEKEIEEHQKTNRRSQDIAYQFPYKSDWFDAEKLRKALNALGFRWDKDSKTWRGGEELGEVAGVDMSQFLVSKPTSAPEGVSFEDDELVFIDETEEANV